MVSSVPAEFQWAFLPSDLKELILAHLSKAMIQHVRSVSREWLAILSSPHFHKLHHRLHPRTYPSLLIYNHAVKISACNWHPADDRKSGSTTQSRPDADSSWQDLSLPTVFVREWVGASGLICVRNHLTTNAFSVGCPFSNHWKALPKPPPAPLLSKLWAMVPHTSTEAKPIFSVLLLQLLSPSVYLDVYNSESNQWVRRNLPTGKGISVSFSSIAACVGGLVYSVQAESQSVVVYDVQRDVWKTLEAELPKNLVFQKSMQGGLVQTVPHVTAGCRGNVLMVGAASYTQNDSSRVCHDGIDAGGTGEAINYAVVWELDWSRKEWREMAKAPADMGTLMVEEAMDARKAAVTPVKYSGHAELVVAMTCGSQRALQFDVIEEKWAWLDLPSAVNCDLTLCLQPESSRPGF